MEGKEDIFALLQYYLGIKILLYTFFLRDFYLTYMNTYSR